MKLPQPPRPRAVATLLLLGLSAACSAVDSARSIATAASDAERLDADVTWLADDAREGRRAGTAGEREAAAWIAARFASMGLEPAGSDGFLQAFEVPLPARAGDGSSVAVVRGAGERGAAGGERVVPLTASAGGEVTGTLAFRGFGITNPDRQWDDYGDVDLSGAVVLIVRGRPSGGAPVAAPDAAEEGANPHGPTVVRGDGWGATTSLFHKVMTAARRGAAAVLVGPHPDGPDEPLPAFGSGGEARAPIPALALSREAAELLVPGYAEAARSFSTADVASAGVAVRASTVRVVADVSRERGVAHNVLARLPGRGGRTVVVGAHFDHLGYGGSGSLDRGGDPAIHNGADDNASGTAVVLELARRLAVEERPAGDVVFALWSGEELGLLGSEHWANHPTIDLGEVGANLNLDMVGRAGNGTLQILGAGTSPAFAGWMPEVGESAGLALEVSLSGQGLGGSDHQTFLKREIPALHLFSGLHGDYHKPSDDAHLFEAEGATRVVELSLDLVRRMQAEGELAYVKPEVGESPQRGARWSVWFGTVPEYAYDGPGLKLAGTSGGSPAERAGLLSGDIVTKVGDVDVSDIYSFMYALQIYKPGDVVLTRYVRDGEPSEVRVTLATRNAE